MEIQIGETSARRRERERRAEERDRRSSSGAPKTFFSLSLSTFSPTHLAQDVSTQDGLGDALVLDWCVVLHWSIGREEEEGEKEVEKNEGAKKAWRKENVAGRLGDVDRWVARRSDRLRLVHAPFPSAGKLEENAFTALARVVHLERQGIDPKTGAQGIESKRENARGCRREKKNSIADDGSLFFFPLFLPSEGCSKPQSTMARRSSGFSKKSLNPEEWMPT